MSDAADLPAIGEVAHLVGKSASSIRRYERRGLLPVPARVSGRRRYPPAVVRTLAVIDTAQRAGLRLDEIRQLLTVSAGDAAVSGHLRQIAARKLPEVRALIERADRVSRWLGLPQAVPAPHSTTARSSTSRVAPPDGNPRAVASRNAGLVT